MVGCQVDTEGGEPEFNSVATGTWNLNQESAADLGTCSQVYEGGPGTSLEMLLDGGRAQANDPNRPYVARVSIMNPDGSSGEVDLACLQGANTGIEPILLESLVCTGELAETFRPDPDLDAAWSIAVRMEGTYTMVVPCTVDDHFFDYAGFDTIWTLSLTGTCQGPDCGSSDVPVGTDGEPLCIQKLRLLGEWSGCGEGASACRPFTDSSEIPLCSPE